MPRLRCAARIFARAAAALAVAGLPGVAAAETDFATAGKVYCVPETITSCTAPGACTTRAASAEDKAKVLQIDFAGKQLLLRRHGEVWSWVGAITGDTVENGVRRIVVSYGGDDDTRKMHVTLAKDGTLSIDYGDAGGAKARCKAAP